MPNAEATGFAGLATSLPFLSIRLLRSFRGRWVGGATGAASGPRVDREWIQAVVSTSFLPECIEKSTIILPRDSESGRYLISVTHDRTGNDLLAHGSATAICTGDRKEVSIDLDLRNSQLGSYFLSTTYEQDQASYYYPLQIK